MKILVVGGGGREHAIIKAVTKGIFRKAHVLAKNIRIKI